jgi:replication factor A1
MKIGELRDGMRGIDLEGKITEISDVRDVRLRSGRPARVADCTLEDETGTVTLSLWNEDIDRVSEGSRVKVSNGYTNTFRGVLQLNVGRYGNLELLEEE